MSVPESQGPVHILRRAISVTTANLAARLTTFGTQLSISIPAPSSERVRTAPLVHTGWKTPAVFFALDSSVLTDEQDGLGARDAETTLLATCLLSSSDAGGSTGSKAGSDDLEETITAFAHAVAQVLEEFLPGANGIWRAESRGWIWTAPELLETIDESARRRGKSVWIQAATVRVSVWQRMHRG